MDENTMTKQLTDAETIDQLLNILKSAGKTLSYEQADRLFGEINQTKCDAAELSGDTSEKVIKAFFAK